MAKERIYELAKELNVPSKELVAKQKPLGWMLRATCHQLVLMKPTNCGVH